MIGSTFKKGDLVKTKTNSFLALVVSDEYQSYIYGKGLILIYIFYQRRIVETFKHYYVKLDPFA